MSIIAKTTLCATTQTAKNNDCYGNATTTTTTTEECVMDKFDGINCANIGIEVKFEFRDAIDLYPTKYTIKANKYAIREAVDGVFRICIGNSDYWFVLLVEADEHNNIDLDKAVYVNLYDIDNTDSAIPQKIKIEDAILMDDVK